MNHLNIVDMGTALEEMRTERDDAIVEVSRLTALNNKLTEDFNTLALDRVQWQERAEKAREKFCKIAETEAWTDTCLDGYRKTPGGLREFAESAAKEIDRSIETGTTQD